MSKDEESPKRHLPKVPTLEVPSITPVVPKVSLILDEPIPNHQSFNNAPKKFPGPDFQNFDTWRPIVPPITNFPPVVNRSSTPPTSASQANSSFCDLSALKFELLELKTLIHKELALIRQDLQNLQPTRPRVATFSIGTQTCIPFREPKPTQCKATNTHCTDYVNSAVQVAVKVSEQGVQTDCASSSPVRLQSSESDSDIDRELDFPEDGENFCKAAVEQIDMMINRAERQEPAVVINRHGGRRQLERIQELQRPIPRNGYPYAHMEGPQPSEVSLGADAMIQRYLPTDKVAESRPRQRQPDYTPGKRFAVMNMTNVSFAVGYEPDRNLPIRGDNCGCPHGLTPSPQHYLHADLDRDYREPRDYAEFAQSPHHNATPYENYQAYEPAGRGYRNPHNRDIVDGDGFEPVARGYRNGQIRDIDQGYDRLTPPERDQNQNCEWDNARPRDRVLDLTAIRRQPKLL